MILGEASGGLCCRDFDKASGIRAYKQWAAKHPKLASTLPTVKTGNGWHVYFIGPEGFRDCGDGELRGDAGHYCLLPPSRHPNGTVYNWIVPLLAGELPLIDPFSVGLARYTEKTERTEKTEEISRYSRLSPASPFSPFTCDEGTRGAVEIAIVDSLPTSAGHRHRKIFDFCRRLRAISGLSEADPRSLRPIVEIWHKQALPTIATKDFAETWADFVHGWDKVKHAAGRGAVEAIFETAAKAKPPLRCVELYGADAPILRLAAFCRALQRTAGDADFFLDIRTAARLLKVCPRTAWKWLRALCIDGILELREKGTQATHRASRYRYRAAKPVSGQTTQRTC